MESEHDTETFKQQRRVKLYKREDTGLWADLGTGYVTMGPLATLEVRSETDSQQLEFAVNITRSNAVDFKDTRLLWLRSGGSFIVMDSSD